MTNILITPTVLKKGKHFFPVIANSFRNLDRWQRTSSNLLDIGLVTNDILHLQLSVKGGIQPMMRNEKRTCLIDDSDSEEENPPSRKSAQQSAVVDDGSVGGSHGDPSQWQPRRIKRRPIMTKLSTQIYLSNDTLRVATLNLHVPRE